MDVYYMSDSIQYGSFRNPLYRDYEKFPYGTLENPLNSPPKNAQQQRSAGYNVAQGKSKAGSKSSKDSCPFCKEQKKRPLGAYMRKRGQRMNSESITEDVEECGEEDQEECMGSGTEAGTSPSNNELAAHNHYHERNHVMGGRFSRQESQDSEDK